MQLSLHINMYLDLTTTSKQSHTNTQLPLFATLQHNSSPKATQNSTTLCTHASRLAYVTDRLSHVLYLPLSLKSYHYMKHSSTRYNSVLLITHVNTDYYSANVLLPKYSKHRSHSTLLYVITSRRISLYPMISKTSNDSLICSICYIAASATRNSSAYISTASMKTLSKTIKGNLHAMIFTKNINIRKTYHP